MKKNVFIIIVLLCTVQTFAQNANDALRYSLVSYSGTAKFMSMSGAFGALGADFSSLSQNPAGIAFYRKSEFTITPGFYSSQTSSDFYRGSFSDFRSNITIGNIGMVHSANLNEGSNALLKGLQLGFGMNQKSSFSNRIFLEGFNTRSSLMSYYADEANNSGSPLDAGQLNEFSSLLAYNANLLVFDSLSGSEPYWVDMYRNVLQRKTVEISGSSREMLLAGGMNFDNKLYLGLTLAFPSLRYEETSTFSEQDSARLSSNADPQFNFDYMSKSEFLLTKGNGFNLKFGFIYKPVEFLRIGGAIHTSTTYNLTDNWNTSVKSHFENGNTYTENSPEGTYDYRLTTPMRALGSVALVLGKIGVLSADYEFIDYSYAKLRADSYNFFDENSTISSNLKSASNWRFGAEFRYNTLAFRAGTSYYGSPYKNKGTDGARMGYSAGLGLREKNYFLDLAFNHQLSKDAYYIYGDTFANNTYSSNQVLLTLGFRF